MSYQPYRGNGRTTEGWVNNGQQTTTDSQRGQQGVPPQPVSEQRGTSRPPLYFNLHNADPVLL